MDALKKGNQLNEFLKKLVNESLCKMKDEFPRNPEKLQKNPDKKKQFMKKFSKKSTKEYLKEQRKELPKGKTPRNDRKPH